MASQSRAAARYHIRAAEPPSWLVDRLTARMADLGRYPSAADENRAMHAVAARHGRPVDEVAMLANLRPRLAPPFSLAGARVPDGADLVVVDEAFADAEAECGARRLATLRAEMVTGLTNIGLDVVDGCAPFVLFTVPDAQLMRKFLDVKGIAVRRFDTFVGFDAIAEVLR